jgi:dipeptidyl aminopeptidase/acylaminoacyl peptidase
VLFGNAEKSNPRISHDGKLLSFLAPVDGVLNIWVGPLDDPAQARPVTKADKRPIRYYGWAFTSRHIFYLQDADGDENWHVYCLDLAGNSVRDLTPIPGVSAMYQGSRDHFPDEILLRLNDRDPRYHELYRVNILTGERKLVQENKEFARFITDDDFRVRLAAKMAADGSMGLFQPGESGGWRPFQTVGHEDLVATHPLSFDSTGNVLYMSDSRGRDTAALVSIDITTGERRVLAEDPRADLGDVLWHPTEGRPEAASFDYVRRRWQVIDPAVAGDLEYLRGVADGDMTFPGRSLDDRHWLVAYAPDNGPVRYYHYDRAARRAKLLFSDRPLLETLPLARMHPVVIKSRDGLEMVSYVSLPPWTDRDNNGRPDEPLPMVLLVHGGPNERDHWGYSAEHQLLANRGYAVLSVNFRYSTGFGKSFHNAGIRQWGAKMHDDLVDGVQWAVAERIADPGRVAIMGASYGGYATLVGLTFTPDTFACGVDMVGVSNLVTWLENLPAYRAPYLQAHKDRIGDHTTEEGRAFLRLRSPLTFAERIKRPLLIVQAANDPRVKQSESDQIVKVLQKKRIPVTYAVLAGEGHWDWRPENFQAVYATTEAFLAGVLGGRCEPFGDTIQASSLTVPVGVEHVPGLREADRVPSP